MILICDNKQFSAHKSQLSRVSSVLASLILKYEDDPVDKNNNNEDENCNKTRTDRIFVDDIEADVLRKILSFVYTGQMDNGDLEKVLRAAEAYQVFNNLLHSWKS